MEEGTMWIFSVAIPVDLPDVIELVRGGMRFLRGLMGTLGVQGVVFEDGPDQEGKK